MNNRYRNVILAVCCLVSCCAASVTMAQDDADMQQFLHQTEELIVKKLQENASEDKEGTDILSCIKNSQRKRKDIKWQLEEAPDFGNETFAPKTPFNYVYTTEYLRFVVNKDALSALFLLPAKSKELQKDTNVLIRELTRAVGEQLIRQQCGDFRSYWCRGDWHKEIRKHSARHLYDAEGRVNPVAIYGLYVEYMSRRHCETKDISLHEFIRKLAKDNNEYQKLADEAEKYYPANGESLHRMLEYEASWSACWVMAKKALFTFCEDDKDADRDGKKLTNIVNRHVQNLISGNLPDAQKNYIHQKYPMNRLTDGLNVPDDTMQILESKAPQVVIDVPESAEEARKQADKEKRQKHSRRICGAYAEYLTLLGKSDLWNFDCEINKKIPNKELEKIVVTVHIELAYVLLNQYSDFIDYLETIHDKATAESKLPEIVHQALAMHKTARLFNSLGYDITFANQSCNNKESFEIARNHKDLIQLCLKMREKNISLGKRFGKNDYFKSRNFEKFMHGFYSKHDGTLMMKYDSGRTDVWEDINGALKELRSLCELLILSGAVR